MYGYFNILFVCLLGFLLLPIMLKKDKNLNFCSVSQVVLDHFCLILQCFHSAHKDRTVVELLENGEEILPSDVGLCTYTPTGAYTFLLESLHESLHIDWQLSIVLSKYSITL